MKKLLHKLSSTLLLVVLCGTCVVCLKSKPKFLPELIKERKYPCRQDFLPFCNYRAHKVLVPPGRYPLKENSKNQIICETDTLLVLHSGNEYDSSTHYTLFSCGWGQVNWSPHDTHITLINQKINAPCCLYEITPNENN